MAVLFKKEEIFLEPYDLILRRLEHTMGEIFQDVLPVEIIDIMVRETNRYADQYFQGKGGVGNLKFHARAKWRDVTREDMTAFIVIILYMGMTRLPTYALYWSTNWLLDLGLKQVISRDRVFEHDDVFPPLCG